MGYSKKRSLLPQWSRSRRSGVTALPASAAVVATVPQWSRSRRSGGHGQIVLDRLLRDAASMEPLPKERGHGRLVEWPEVAGDASMEPLPKERGHANADPANPAELRGLNGAAPEGAGSRSTPGRSWAGSAPPQWSRSRRSGVTPADDAPPPSDQGAPQWSRSRRSEVTLTRPKLSLVQDEASMEPLPKERGHRRANRRHVTG